MRDTYDKQWKIDMEHQLTILIPQWEAACFEIDSDWAAAKQLAGQAAKKPEYPPKPKRPQKVKIEGEMSIPSQNSILEGLEDIEVDGGTGNSNRLERHELEGSSGGDLVSSMQALGISHFSEVGTLTQSLAF